MTTVSAPQMVSANAVLTNRRESCTMPVFRVISLVSICLLLAGCNRPGPHFRDLPATRVMVQGSTFDVRVQRRLAEALRVNAEYAPRLGPIGARAARAMEVVSGCRVVEIRGDAALVTGILDCGEGRRPRLVRGHSYECDIIERYTSDGQNITYTDYDCYVVPY